MRKQLAPLSHDIKFQLRHGFYIAYLAISIIYVAFLRVLPVDIRNFILPIIVFTDPAVLGCFFVAGIFFLERDQNILENLFVTPYSIRGYILNKVISLGLISYLSSVFIAVFSVGFSFNWILYTVAILLSATFFTLLGLILVVRARNLNLYIMYAGLFLLIFNLPLIQYLDLYHNSIFKLIPTTSSIYLIVSSFSTLNYYNIIAASLHLLLGCFLAYKGAHRSIENYVVLRIGGGNK